MSSSKNSTNTPPDGREGTPTGHDKGGQVAPSPPRSLASSPWAWGVMIVVFMLLLWAANQAGYFSSSSLFSPPDLGGEGLSSSLWLVFLTGLTAGGLSCLAVQGGLLATTVARREQLVLQEASQGTGHATPILLFLLAKLVAYTLLGALLGLFGSWISLSVTMRGWLQILIGLFMLGMALQMLDVHPIFRYLVIQPPKGIQRFVRKSSKGDDAFTPLFLGALTVFIPCGVTQAIALLALGSGSATWGALIMSAFVLGTFPIFFLLGLATARLSSLWEGTFMQVAAIAIVFMALYSMLAGSRLLGYQIGFNNPVETADATRLATPIPTLANEAQLPSERAAPAEGMGAGTQAQEVGQDGYQEVTIAAMNEGYQPQLIKLRAGVPARINLVTNETYSCARAFVIPALGVEKILPETGTETIEFTPEEPGNIPFTCSMGMYTGVIEVVANDAQAPEVAQAPEAPEVAGAAPMATQATEGAFEQVGHASRGYQEVTIAAMNEGYQPQLVKLRAGVPARINLVTNETYSCARAFVIPALGVEKILPETGTETIEFTPEEPGNIPFTCSMGMYTGVIEVVANDAQAPEVAQVPEEPAMQGTEMEQQEMEHQEMEQQEMEQQEMTDEAAQENQQAAAPQGDGRLLLMASEQDRMQVFMMNSDGTGLEQLTSGPDENFHATISPDGAWVAYTSRHEENLDIYLMNIESREVKQLTNEPSRDYQPIFSPDSNQIAFISERDGDPDIWIINRDGSGLTQLLNHPEDQHLGAWSPDGQSIVFVDHQHEQKRSIISNIALADGRVRKLTELGSINDAPVFSPDGQRIAFYSNRTGDFNIFTMAADGSDIKQLTHDAQKAFSPIYSPDGNWIIYGQLGGESIQAVPATGGAAKALTTSLEIQALPTGWAISVR